MTTGTCAIAAPSSAWETPAVSLEDASASASKAGGPCVLNAADDDDNGPGPVDQARISHLGFATACCRHPARPHLSSDVAGRVQANASRDQGDVAHETASQPRFDLVIM
jgi:hypothetical protein